MATKKKKGKRTPPSLAVNAPSINKKYQEEDDAYTLSRAEEIKSDKSRMKGAVAGAKRTLARDEERLKGLKKVARKKV